MIKKPSGLKGARPADDDVLSDVLRTVRLAGSLQFCFMPTGAWQTEGKGSLSTLADNPSIAIPFHVLVEGSCWLKMEGRQTALEAGDVLAFPFGTPHQLGAGSGGRLIAPVADLPPKPWREVPVLRYGADRGPVRLLCGYLQCDAMKFRPLRDALPALMHVRTAGANDAGWLRATIEQMVREVDRPQTGGLSMVERLTEITFIELLRHQVIGTAPGSVGWLAALADPSLARCLSVIHDDPKRAWSVQDLAAASALSRSALTERFEIVLDTSPMRYVREWRLCLAGMALTTTGRTIAAIANDAGYGTEAAFTTTRGMEQKLPSIVRSRVRSASRPRPGVRTRNGYATSSDTVRSPSAVVPAKTHVSAARHTADNRRSITASGAGCRGERAIRA